MEKDLGERIRMLRGNESRQNFARRFGTSHSSLVRWENGDRTPDLGFLSKLTYAYGMPLQWFIDGTGAPELDEAIADGRQYQLQKSKQPTENKAVQKMKTADVGSSQSKEVTVKASQVEEMAALFSEQTQDLRKLIEENRKLMEKQMELTRELADQRVANAELRAELSILKADIFEKDFEDTGFIQKSLPRRG